MSAAGTVAADTSRPNSREDDIVTESLREFAELQVQRNLFNTDNEQIAALIMPTQRNTFVVGSYSMAGQRKNELQVDATGMLANAKFAAIVDSMATPFLSRWHTLQATNPQVNKDRQCRLWFEAATNALFDMRYHPHAGFRRNNQGIWQFVGAFGNGPMFIDQRVDMRGNPERGVRYKASGVGEYFIRENHQGQIDGFCRYFRMTPRQAVAKWPKTCPEQVKTAADRMSEQPIAFLHRVCPNNEYDPGLIDGKSKLFASYYIALEGNKLLSEGGYNSFPLAYARAPVGPNEVYGRGWANDVLPSLKTLNAEKTIHLKVGHRTADPILLGGDDGLVPSLRPGAWNPGMVNADGKPMAVPLELGNIQITKEMMDDERAVILDASFVKIFEALVENPNMKAAQVYELINQKGVFLAPTVGGTATDYLGSLIDRELDLAIELHLLDPMPPLLQEAKGEYKVVYTSPLFKAQRAGEWAGFLRMVESALEIVGQTQDPSHLDRFNFDKAWSYGADVQSVPESLLCSDDEVAAKQQQRAKAKAQEQQVQSLPAQAAMLKAQASVQKQGGIPTAPGFGGGPPQQQQ